VTEVHKHIPKRWGIMSSFQKCPGSCFQTTDPLCWHNLATTNNMHIWSECGIHKTATENQFCLLLANLQYLNQQQQTNLFSSMGIQWGWTTLINTLLLNSAHCTAYNWSNCTLDKRWTESKRRVFLEEMFFCTISMYDAGNEKKAQIYITEHFTLFLWMFWWENIHSKNKKSTFHCIDQSWCHTTVDLNLQHLPQFIPIVLLKT